MNDRELEKAHMIAEFLAHRYVYPDHRETKREKKEPKNRHPYLRTVSVKRASVRT